MIQIPKFINDIFNARNIDTDCHTISYLMRPIANNIQELIDTNCQESAATLFIQLAAATALHFITEEHWCYFDDLYSPDYTLQAIAKSFDKLNQEKKLGENAKQILVKGMEEIKQMESVIDYGYPDISFRSL